jgi:hypothetical protein
MPMSVEEAASSKQQLKIESKARSGNVVVNTSTRSGHRSTKIGQPGANNSFTDLELAQDPAGNAGS